LDALVARPTRPTRAARQGSAANVLRGERVEDLRSISAVESRVEV
jgi:hypothetical protein